MPIMPIFISQHFFVFGALSHLNTHLSHTTFVIFALLALFEIGMIIVNLYFVWEAKHFFVYILLPL
jgi:hypothetical protein